MQDTHKKLIELLKKDDRLVIDGVLAKNKVIELALQLDVELLRLLRSSNELSKTFFQEIDDVIIFDKVKFQSFVSNKQFLPDSFTEYKNKIGLISDKKYLTDNEEVVLAFPYKDCVLEGGQTKEDAKRNEVFWNETLAPDEIDKLLEPKVLTNFKKYDNSGEHLVKEISTDDNLIIKGNNLLALHSLEKTHKGKVKLIYIDPPYNTGSDSFQYNDNFNHSTWLTFMKNRLKVAKDLLTNDGIIFVQCDNREQAYLKVLMDEVFGNENFLSTISYQRSGVAGLGQGGKFVVNITEYINVFSKSFKDFTPYNLTSEVPLEFKHMKRYNSILKSSGEKTLFREFESKSTGELVKIYKHKNFVIEKIPLANFEENKENILKTYKEFFDRVFRLNVPQDENSFQWGIINSFEDDDLYSVEYLVSRGKNKGENVTNYYFKKQLFAWLKSSGDGEGEHLSKVNKMSDFWTNEEIPKADLANEGGVTLGRGKKPEQLLKRIISISTKENDLVLDYHLGSGTTCAVAHKMGRRYIGIEQLDYGNNDSVVRLQNVINGDTTGVSKSVKWQSGGSFVYAELAQANQIFVDKIQNSKNTKELLKVWDEMKSTAFLSYKVKPEEIDATKKNFETLSFEDQQRFLVSTLDKNLLYIPYSEIDDKTYGVSKEDKELNRMFYGDK